MADKGLALQTALDLLMARDVSVTGLAHAFKKISLDLNDHKDFIVQQVEDFDRYVQLFHHWYIHFTIGTFI